VPPDILRLDPEPALLKSDPDLLQFYTSFSANPLFAKMEELCRQNMAARLAQAKSPEPPPAPLETARLGME
jgi:hypothetical protein